MTFDEAFEKLIGHEGGFQDDPQDKGNWTGGRIGKGELKGTKFGISAASYPHLDIKNLTLEDAKAIYEQDFWDKALLNSIQAPLDFTLFDIAVNSGVTAAHKYLQKALGVEADGIIGRKTLEALYRVCDYDALNNRVNAIRLLEMTDMKGFSRYGKGWVRRVAKNILESNET